MARGRRAKSAKNGTQAGKYSVLSSTASGNSQLHEANQKISLRKKQYKTSLAKSAVKSIAFVTILSAMALYFPYVRWNMVLFAYMPTMSGLYLNLEWLLEDLRRSYLNFEMSSFPSLFSSNYVAQIPVDQYSWQNFLQASENFAKPVILRGLFKGSKAEQTFGTDEWVEKYNDFKIQGVKTTEGTYKYNYELEEKEFKEFAANLKAGKFGYGYGLDEIYYRYPELVNDLELERLSDHHGNDSNACSTLALFIGGTAVGLRWHNADHGNIGIMLQGSKTFHLIDPKYSMFMGPEGNRDPYSTGFAARSPKEIIDKLPQTSVEIYSGDVIYIPPWYWHAVETIADNRTNTAILNVCRFSAIVPALLNAPALELYRHQGFINWLHPKIPIAARFIPYFRVVQDGIREIFNAMPRWDSPDCYSSKKRACETYFKSVGWL